MAAFSGPALIEQIEEARLEGRNGAFVTGNVDDYLVCAGESPVLIVDAIARYFARKRIRTLTASLAAGLAAIEVPGADLGSFPVPQIPRDGGPESILRALTPLLCDPGDQVAVVILHPSHFAPCGDHPTESERVCAQILYGWSSEERIRRSGSFAVLLDPEDRLHPLVREHAWGLKLVRAGYAARDEREAFAALYLRAGTARPATARPDADSPARIAELTGGLRLAEIEALLRGATSRGERVSEERLRAERAAKISERLSGIAEVKEPTIGWSDVAGLPHVKDRFQEVARAAQGGAAGLTGSTLLAGVPGVGKSFTAEALARELRVPIVFVRNLYDQWVGSSEARVERLIETLVAFDGCVCVFEEVDQLLGRRDGGPSGDSGTTERVRGRLMEFMGGAYPGIHFVGLTNRPDLLDVANQDRFSVLIPVLHPGFRDRVALLPALFAQERRKPDSDVDFESVASLDRLQMVSVRSLRDVVRMAGRLADHEAGAPGTTIAQRHLQKVVEMFHPKHDLLEHEYLALTAVAGCQFRAYLPWMSWDGRRKEVDLPSYLDGIVDGESGAVDEGALRRRLRELADERRVRRIG